MFYPELSFNGLSVVVRPYAELKMQESFANETAAVRNPETGDPQQEAHQGSESPTAAGLPAVEA